MPATLPVSAVPAVPAAGVPPVDPGAAQANASASGPARDATDRTVRLRPGGQQGERIAQLTGSAYGALGRHDAEGARSAYEQVLALDRNNADALVGLATLSARRTDYVTAERLYQRALEVDPNSIAARSGLLSIRSGADPVALESHLRNLIARDANQPSLHFALGNALARQARWPDAQQAYFNAFSGDPKRPEYAFNLAVSLDRLRQPKPAIEYYRRALALAESQPAGFSTDAARARLADLERAAGRPGSDPAAPQR